MSTPGLPTTRDPFATGPRGATGATAAAGSPAPSGTAGTAKDEAAGVASDAAASGKHVAGVAKDQAADVLGQAKGQAADLLGQTRTQLSEQTTAGQQRAATGLGSLAGELRDLAEGRGGSGIATDLAHQASRRVDAVGTWLGDREPSDVLREVQAFARRRPVAFLALAAGAGLVAGRLTRGLTAAAHEASASSAPAGNPTRTPAGTGSSERWSAPTANADQALVTGTADPVYGTTAAASTPRTALVGEDRGWDGMQR